MALSNSLASQFVKEIQASAPTQSETKTVTGTAKLYSGKMYVQIDGADQLTPIASSTVGIKDGDKVTVQIKNHSLNVTGNTTDPAVSKTTGDSLQNGLTDTNNKLDEFGTIVADKASINDLTAATARIGELEADNVIVKNTLTAVNADITNLEADNVTINNKLTAAEADIDHLTSSKIDASVVQATYATIANLEATNANIHNLEADFGDFEELTTTNFDAMNANINNLQVNKLDASSAEILYANIDFANIGTAAIEKLFSDSGIIKDLVMSSGHVTGELVGVTIKGDLIEANTIAADSLMIKGNDGLFYKLNTDGVKITAEQTNYNSLNGSVITAKSVTADKVNVTDLTAFGATIGGYHITSNSLYSGSKSSATNTTRGVFMNSSGEFSLGDSSNYLRYYKDSSNTWKLEISAQEITLGATSLPDYIDDAVSNVQVGGRNCLVNSAFKDASNFSIFTFEDNELIVTSTSLGNTGNVYRNISLTDFFVKNARNKKVTISIDYKIETAITYGTTNPWVGFQLAASRNSTTGGTSQYLSWYGGRNFPTAVTNKWVRYSTTVQISDYDIASALGQFYFRDATGKVRFRNPKVEIGSTSTNWTPAPEDVDADIDDISIGGRNFAEGTNTDAIGNWVWSMQVGDYTREQYTLPDGYIGTKLIRGTTTASGWNVIRYDKLMGQKYALNTEYVVSFDVYPSVNANFNASFTSPDGSVILAYTVAGNEGTAALANTWTKMVFPLKTVASEPASRNVVLYLTGMSYATGVSYIFKNLKIEIGNKPTDWTPAPEDVATDINNAQDVADDAKEQADKAYDGLYNKDTGAWQKISALDRTITNLVRDENGQSLVVQHPDGLYFNMESVTKSINEALSGVEELDKNKTTVAGEITALNEKLKTFDHLNSYVYVTETTSGQPVVWLGENDSPFKVQITNTAINFIQGTDAIAYITNKKLYITSATMTDELQIGSTSGYIWKKRTNNHLGLRYVS